MAKTKKKLKIVTRRGKNGELQTEMKYFDKELKREISAIVGSDISMMDVVVAGLNKILREGDELPEGDELKLFLLPSKPKAGI